MNTLPKIEPNIGELNMCRIFGYGEDAFTLWALKHYIAKILKSFQDKTSPSNCLIFYRPSFGRRGGAQSAEFGEFDGILASSENIYLIESKWDNLSKFEKDEITIRPEQKLRHQIFSWYITCWDRKYSNDWENFIKGHTNDFQKKFPEKKITPPNKLLTTNLQFILNSLQKHCLKYSSEQNIKNILLFFYNKNKSTPPTKITKGFTLISIDYSKEINGNFITLD